MPGITVAIRSVSAEPEKRPEVVKMVKTCQSWCKKLGATTKLEYLGMQKHANGDEIALPPVLCAQFGNDPENRNSDKIFNNDWTALELLLLKTQKRHCKMYRRGIKMVKCKYIAYHVFINFITVIVCNNALLSTICQDQILSCCDPMNSLWFKLPAHLGPCAWLIGHTIGYFHAAYCWAGSCWKCHLTLIMCQFIWALSETVIFQGVHDSDNLLTCNHEIVYPSTWQPIWQDFIYNSIGHLGGFTLYNFYCHKVIGLIWKIKHRISGGGNIWQIRRRKHIIY